MKPFIKYPGGKQKELPLVEKYKPKSIERYFEPFLGGASVYLNINVEKSYINDFSADLINFYKFVQSKNEIFFNYLEEMERVWSLIEKEEIIESFIDLTNFQKYFSSSLKTKNKKISKFEKEGIKVSQKDKLDIILTAKKTSLYMIIRDIYNEEKDNLELRTASFYFMREYCYSSMFRFSKNGKFNVPYGGRSYNFKYMTDKINYMKSKEIINYFKATRIYNLDFEKFLNKFELNEGEQITVDFLNIILTITKKLYPNETSIIELACDEFQDPFYPSLIEQFYELGIFTVEQLVSYSEKELISLLNHDGDLLDALKKALKLKNFKLKK